MTNMKKISTTIVVLFFLSFLPVSTALEAIPGWQATCANSTHIYKEARIYFNDTLYEFNQTIQCQYGCDTDRDICWKWPGNALPSEYFLLFQVVVLGIFFVVVFRLDTNTEDIKIFDVVLPVLLVTLFFSLSLQGNNIIDMATGEAVQVIFVVWLDFGLGIISLLFFFLNLFKFAKEEVSEK